MVGKTLGHYEILEPLGQGGMGEVYLAEDMRLKRNVAIKVLPPDFAADADRLARLQREAQLLATLNHPHVAGIYGFEREGETSFLAMELVEGRGLDEMVAAGPLPVDEALELAAQIAAGVEAAHEKGIMHRDLKPANVRVTADGQAKVLDFGLAKGDPDAGLRDISPELSASPTMAVPTMAGVILGTAAYMSPEQARGKPLDRRTDIWSFGCVLYEMLTGRRAFGGETVTDVLASVVKETPDWEALPEELPWRVRDLLRRCFQKNPRERMRDIGDARLALRQAIADPREIAGGTSSIAAKRASRGAALPWGIALLMALLAAWGWLARDTGERDGDFGVARLALIVPEAQHVTQYSTIALSPTGAEVVYRAVEDGVPRLYRRDIDDRAGVPIEGTDGAAAAFLFSPDGSSLGFSSGASIRTVSLAGGPALEVCDPCAVSSGATWGPDDHIVFGRNWAEALSIVPAAGGRPRFLTQLDRERGDTTHVYPQYLPDGRVLFTIWTPEETYGAVATPADGSTRVLHTGGFHYRYAASGHLLYVRGGTLLAAPFDLATDAVGAGAPVADGVFHASADGFAAFEVSRDGILAYREGGNGNQHQPVWIERSGDVTPAMDLVGSIDNLRLSPDGERIALSYVGESGFQIAEHDLRGRSQRQLTRVADNLTPIYSPDGNRLLYSSTLHGGYSLLASPTAGAGEPESLVQDEYVRATDWWSDGSRELVIFQRRRPETNLDLWALVMGDQPQEIAIAATAEGESAGVVSPDGRWIAYVSNAGGESHINIVSSEPGSVSNQIARGTEPRWNPAGGELFFRSGQAMMSLPLIDTEPLQFGAAVQLFSVPGLSASSTAAHYDVSRDGERFLALREVDPGPGGNHIQVILNAFELLQRVAPSPYRR